MDEDNHSVDSPAQSNPGTPLPSNPGTPRNDKNDDIALVTSTCYQTPQSSSSGSSRQQPKPKYSQLLAIIEELGKDIRPTYAGSRSSAERLKRGIVHAQFIMAKHNSITKAEMMSSMSMEFCADSIEWCPFHPFSQFLVCGTYQLNKESTDDEQSRQGNISLFKFSASSSQMDNFKLVTTHVMPTSGILDMKWCPDLVSNKPVLAAACSDGKLLLNSLNEDKDEINLLPNESINLSTELNKILLSLDWSCENQQPHKIITSDNLGNLTYFAMRETNLCMVKAWKAHDFESWVAAFDYEQSDIVYSGGDDCCMKCWDLRDSQLPVLVNKSHSMGVTAISKSKMNEHILATGSYDENVYLWDTRLLRSPVSEACLGGGIWRLKWHPDNPEYMLSASMHNGFHVLSTKDSQIKLKLHYENHESLAYGIDWCHISECYKTGESELCPSLKNRDLKNIIASCSFYDKLLTVWGIDF